MRAAREEFMQFLCKEDGATAVEYALIAGIICLAIVGGCDSCRDIHRRFAQQGR
jgi:Flp pilus assembly pilin Flp